MLDWRNRADVAIIIAIAAVIAAIVSDIVVTGGAIIVIGSIIGVHVVGVPAVISIVIFVRRPGAQKTPCRRVLLGRLVVILLFRGGVVPFPGHIIVVIFIF
jgi:hypothetical protein